MLNQVMLMGWTGRDPEMYFTPGGTAYAKFTIGSTRKWRDENGEQKELVEWSNIIVWGRTAEVCNQYLTKGRLVFVRGYLKTERWTADGIAQRRTVIVAEDVKFIPTSRPSDIKERMPLEELPQDLGRPMIDADPPPTPKQTRRQKPPAAQA